MEKLKNNVLGVLERVPLDDNDIKQIINTISGKDQRIMTYSQLANYRSINDLLPNDNDDIILLYEQEENTGHWCCLKKLNGKYYYFNSYGGKIDDPLEWNTEEKNIELGQDKPYLSILLSQSPLDTYFNMYCFQNKKQMDISTCGLWCISFLTSNLDLHQFYDYFLKLKKHTKLSNDKLITQYIIQNILN